MRTVALACQGGGSHTAFTGGVPQRLLADENHRVVALSGTSGGAVYALLAWYGLLTGGAAEAGRLLERSWEDTAATSLGDRAANAWLVSLARLEGRVALPTVSPYAYPDVAGAAFTGLLTAMWMLIGWPGCRSSRRRASRCCSLAPPTSSPATSRRSPAGAGRSP
jgi:NTE family protein